MLSRMERGEVMGAKFTNWELVGVRLSLERRKARPSWHVRRVENERWRLMK